MVWILNDNKKDEWVDKTRITNVIDWEWPIRIPIFYDGEILVLHQRQRGNEGELRMYDIVADKWRKFGVVEGKPPSLILQLRDTFGISRRFQYENLDLLVYRIDNPT